jgi:hypothetical protein
MNRRVLLSGSLVAVCLATLWGLWSQRGQVAGLRAEQQQLMALVAAKADAAGSAINAEAGGASSGTGAPALVATPELLRLRSEVTRLTERRRELAGVRADNERLRGEPADRGTNGPAGLRLPPGYLLRSKARMVGYNTPEDTLQSLLWAVQNRDLTNLLQAFTARSAEIILDGIAQSNRSIQRFFRDSVAMPGMAIVDRRQDTNDGSIKLEVDVAPGVPHAEIRFQQTTGQWKIAGPF